MPVCYGQNRLGRRRWPVAVSNDWYGRAHGAPITAQGNGRAQWRGPVPSKGEVQAKRSGENAAGSAAERPVSTSSAMVRPAAAASAMPDIGAAMKRPSPAAP